MNGAEEQEAVVQQQMIDVGVTPEEMDVIYKALGYYVDGYTGIGGEHDRQIGIAMDLQTSFLPPLQATHPHYVETQETQGGGPNAGFPVAARGAAEDGVESGSTP